MIDQPSTPESQTLIINLEELIQVINAEFEQEQVALPTRQYIGVGGAGDTAWDCEQLTVTVEQIYSGLPGQQSQEPVRCDMPHSGVIIVSLVRCIPGPTQAGRAAPQPPTAEALDAYGRQALVDAWILMRAGQTFADTQSFVGGLTDVTVSPPQGQYQALVMTLITGLA